MLDALNELGLENDTIVVFASDNGPQPTLARLAGGKVPDDRPIDGVDQTDLVPGRSGWGGSHLLPGTSSSAAPMNGYPKVFNIESDPREEHNIGALYEWVTAPTQMVVEEYKASLQRYPNPPAANITRF
jgi:arylsulfatase